MAGLMQRDRHWDGMFSQRGNASTCQAGSHSPGKETGERGPATLRRANRQTEPDKVEATEKPMEKLSILRGKIDRLDESLIRTLALRFEITDEIGKLKKSEKLPPVDPNREQEQMQAICAAAKAAGLRESVALAVLRLIIDTVVEDHTKV